MVDQIRAWLDLIPPEERKRWSWLLDQNESTFGMPRMVDTPVGRVYNPLAYPGDVAGALGTAISDPIKENVLQPATGALFHAANRLPGGGRRPFTSEAEVPLEEYTPEGLRRYLKANTEGSFLGELSAGILSDPLTFVGGPIGRVARGVEALPLLNRVPGVARGAGAVAAADEAYVRAMGALVEGGLARTGEFAKTLPVVGKLFQDSPQKALTAFQIESQLAERGASQALRARGQNWRDILEPPRMDVKGTAREWKGTIEPTYTQFDEEVAGLAHPAQQVEMLRLRQQAAETENLLNTRGEQSRIAVMEGMAEGDITPKLGEAQIRKSWQMQQKGVRALQIGLFDALDAVKAAAPDTLGAIDDPTRAAITSQITDVTGAIRGFHDDASQVGLTLRGGLSPEEGDRITGIFNMKDPQQRIMAMQAQDLAYRGAYDKTVARLDQTVFDLEKKYGDLFDADSVAAVRQTLADTFRATQDLLAPATQPIEQTLAGLGRDQLQTMMDLWQSAPLSFPKALTRVVAVRDRIAGEAEPLIRRWYEEAYSFKNRGQTLSAAEIDQRVERALSSATYLMRDPALLDPANAGVRKQIADLLTKYAPGGDILNPDHTGRIAMNLLVKPKAAELGITSTPPWFSPMSIMLGAWKELALMSPRFHFANMIGQLLLSEADGVSSGRVATMQARKLRQLATERTVDDAFDATASPGYAAWRDTGDEVVLPPGVTGNTSDATMLPGGRGADTNLGRIPIAIRAGVPALATGGAAWAATPNDEDRNRNAMVAALLGGSFGAAAPRFARANRLLAQVTETGARGAAFLTGVEQAMGTLVADGKGKGLLQQFHNQIPELLESLSMPVVGKRMTPLGGTETLTTMQDLFAPGRTLGGTPQIAVQSGERLGAATTIGEGVDVAAVQRAFADAGGKMSPDALADVARKAGATEEQALRLRAGFDETISQAETIGMARSNKIHFDYSDISNGVQWLRDSGVAPFSVWQTKAMPVYTKLMLQHPGFIVAINELNDLSDDDIQDAGLTGKFARMAHLGELGTALAEQVLGRADGTVMSNVLGAVFPYSEVGVDRDLGPDANPLERGLQALQGVGLGPSPLVTLPLMAAGATDELPPSLFRTSAYLGAGTQALTGVEADPEMLTKRIMRGARTLTGAPVEPTVTGDFLKDRAIRQRIAETAVEDTGKPPAGPYLLAMDDPASQIWQRAQAQVERQRSGQTLLGAIVPAKTKFLSDTEAQVRAIRDATGVGPADSAARRAQPATAAELASAELAARKKPLTVGETLAERAATARYYAAEEAAASINPLARTLNNLGGKQALGRQYPEWIAFQRRIRHMNPKRKGQMIAEYLGQRPALREYVATHDIYN